MVHEYHPLSGEYVVTGVLGMLLYISIIYFSIQSVNLGIKSKSTKRFFFCLIVMALFEIPRFMAMAVEGDYNSEVAYCFHILAGTFFFAAFSLVCRQWSGLLQLGSYFRAVYGRNGLIVANILFGIVDLVAVIACGTASSLSSFFSSTGFEVITFIEGVRNCVYSIFLAYYGIKLVKRFWHFSRIERQAAANKSIFSYVVYWHPIEDQDVVFTKVVLRMTSVLILSSACFICRVGMLIAKMAAVHSSDQITTPTFTLFGFLWFCFSDFIPRALPTIAFIFLMRTKKPVNQIKRATVNKRTSDGDEFQFVQLADDESFYNLSDLERSNSLNSTTEVMLNADLYVPDNKRSLHPVDMYSSSSGVRVGRVPSSHNNSSNSSTTNNSSSDIGSSNNTTHPALPRPFDNSTNNNGAALSSRALLTRYEADDESNDDDFYSLDDHWDSNEPTILDRFFSSINFSATNKIEGNGETRSGRIGKEGTYEAGDIRL